MAKQKLRILLMGDASNYHHTLAVGLRRLGHDVTVASAGSGWMRTDRDIDLSRPMSGKVGGALLWLKLKWLLSGALQGYDVVSLSSVGFVNQTPERSAAIFDTLRRHNGKVFLTALGTDALYVRECIKPDTVLPINEWSVNGKPSPLAEHRPELLQSWLSKRLTDYTQYIYDNIAGATTVLYEYDIVTRQLLPDTKVGYVGIPIDTKSITPVKIPKHVEKVNIFLGRHSDRKLEKGTDMLEQAAREVVKRHPERSRLTIVENRPFSEYISLLRQGHIILDQLYSYTPATNALLAMAMGLNTVSGGAPEYYNFIGEHDNRPIINADVHYPTLLDNLERAVLDSENIASRGRDGREFVIKHNDCETVAARAVEFWTKYL